MAVVLAYHRRRRQANLLRLVQGPRVGDKTPIDAITAEYAKADPVYVAKTMVSPVLLPVPIHISAVFQCGSGILTVPIFCPGSATNIYTLQAYQGRRQLWMER